MQVDSGLRAILSSPMVYETWQLLLGAKRKRGIQRDDYIKPFEGMRIFDIGCGPAHILAHLENIEYFGVDLSAAYIDKARENYGDKGEFSVQSADAIIETGRKFDLVMALGLLHHLEDDQCTALFNTAKQLLDKGGRVITFDGVYTDNQSKFEKYLLAKDRGQNVRTEPEYVDLAKGVFGVNNTISHIRTDMTRIPYTHILLECTLNDERG